MKIKRVLVVLSSTLMVALAAFGISACGGSDEHEHVYGDWMVTQEATCVEDGSKEHVCSVCGEKQSEIIPAGHAYGEWVVTKEATCVEDGIMERTCSVCGDKLTETIPLHHTESAEGVVTKEAACTENGVKTFYCQVCGEVTRTETILATGHHYDTGIVTTQPGCVTTGIKTFTCADCGETKTEVILATGHTASAEGVVTKEATCTENGLKTFYCQVCGEALRTETILATGHHYDNSIVTTQPGCATTGVKTYTCSDCGDEKTEIVPATGLHTYGDWTVIQEPTCVATGTKEHACSVCGYKQTETILATGLHTYGDWTVIQEPTCVATGTKEHTCNVCGGKQTDSIPATGVHTYGEWTESKAPTCTEDGVEKVLCSVCGKELDTRTTDSLGHDYSEAWTVDVMPTCTVEGSKSHHCNRCGDKGDITSIPVLGHNYGDWEMIEKPTFSETGVLIRKCLNDSSHTETFILPVLDKIKYTYNNISESTCTSNGQDKYVYSKGEQEFTIIVTLEKKEHTPVTVEGKAPTCTETGLTEGKKCSVCDTVIVSQNLIFALGHDFTTAECSICKAIQDGYTAISNVTELLNIESNMSGKYVLTADITLSESWTSLGKGTSTNFKGVFDGNNHTISGLTVSNTDYGGLFYKNAGTIKNLNLSDISFTIDYYEDISNQWPTYGNVSATFGGIAAVNSGEISNSQITGKITLSTRNYLGLWFTSIGGGTDQRNDFYNSYSLGGVVGTNSGTVSNCTVSADLSYSYTNYMGSGFGLLGGVEIGGFYLHSSSSIGGIVGTNNGTVNSCIMKGDCSLVSNQTADSWSGTMQSRTVGLEVCCNFGSLIGNNCNNVINSYGTLCTITKNHKTQGTTSKASISVTINNEINSGVIGYNSDSGKTTNCGIYTE